MARGLVYDRLAPDRALLLGGALGGAVGHSAHVVLDLVGEGLDVSEGVVLRDLVGLGLRGAHRDHRRGKGAGEQKGARPLGEKSVTKHGGECNGSAALVQGLSQVPRLQFTAPSREINGMDTAASHGLHS